MGSSQNFTPNCGTTSFPEVVAGTTGASKGGRPRQNKRAGGKENLQPEGDGEALPTKPKRKYVWKAKTAVSSQALPSSAAPVTAEGEGNQGNTSNAGRGRAVGRGRGGGHAAARGRGGGRATARGGAARGCENGRGRGRLHSLESVKHGDYGEDSGGEEASQSQLVNSRDFPPPITRAHSLPRYRVYVCLRDLLWGGEVLPVPCPYAVGTVLGGEVVDGTVLLQVDFGAYLGVQAVPRIACMQVELATACAQMGGVDSSSMQAEFDVACGDTTQIAVESGMAITISTDEIESLPQPEKQSLGLSGWELEDTDSEHDWDPKLSDLGSEEDGFSSGASSIDMKEDDPFALLGELGIYSFGPELQKVDLEEKYSERHWHARTWSLMARQPFKGKPPGASDHLPTNTLMQPIDYFILFWDETLQRKIVRESNEYANYIDPATGKRKGGESTTKPITLEEFRQFTGICCLMGVRDQPCIRDYWRRGHGALFCEDVATTMSRWRFEYILRCLHMTSRNDFVTDKRSPNYDPIGKCRWILQHVEGKFQQFWNLSPYITVDECMVAYNGRFCSFKQYLPAKPISHGIKIWAMACAVTSYVYKLEIYVGKDNAEPAGPAAAHIGMAWQVVSRLTKGLEGQWYTVTCDNYFTSPYLFDDLLARGFYAVGTARKQRKGFPTSLGITHEQPRGTLHIQVHKDCQMAAIHWQDTKGVYFLATATDPMVPGGVVTNRISGQRLTEVPTSPIQLLYSQTMGGVDVGDQNRSYYSTQIATKKWWHRVYFFCQDSCIANAFTIHKETSKKLEVKPLTHKEFQLRVVYSLMGRPYRDGGLQRPTLASRRVPFQPCSGIVSHVPRKTNLRRVCRICKRRTFWICPQCTDSRLCLLDCFEFFHTPGIGS